MPTNADPEFRSALLDILAGASAARLLAYRRASHTTSPMTTTRTTQQSQ